MWEHFTTKPYLDEVRFIDHVLTPWSSWMIAASTKARQSDLLKDFMSRLSESVRQFDDQTARASSSKEFVMNHFKYPEEDVKAWLEGVKYPSDVQVVEQKTLENTLECASRYRCSLQVLTLSLFVRKRTLEKAGVLQKPSSGWQTEEFIDTSVAKLQ